MAYLIRYHVAALVLLAVGAAAAEELRLTARELFERSSVQNLRLSADGKAIELIPGLLIETDGDAAGYSYKPNEENLSDGRVAIKWLTIPAGLKELASTKAYLLVGHTGKKLAVEINGKPVELGEPQKAGNYWKRYAIPGETLLVGKNEFRLTGDGKLWIARADERSASFKAFPPQQSAKQSPGQETPSFKLGAQSDILGEYYVRLYLDKCFRNGTLRTSTLDLSGLIAKSVPSPRHNVETIRVELEGAWPQDVPRLYASWAPAAGINQCVISDGQTCTLDSTEERPLALRCQIDLDFLHDQDSVCQTSPRLEALRISIKSSKSMTWGDRLLVTGCSVPELAFRGNWPQYPHVDIGAHERLDHPRLAKLRDQYKLDEVVKGCTTDLERMQKLAVWSSQQWTKGHLKDIYPKWDALEILKLNEDGTPVGGFCQQYNIVFLQACQSFGMVGRCVSIGAGDHGVNIRSGHEVVEIWSNELNKWVYVDGQAAWYFVDKESRQPLNLLELRERQIAALRDIPFRETEVVVLAKSPYEWKGLKEWPAFCELRMIPHTQFLDGKLPIPLNQGMRGWFWTGHHVWTDDMMPASILYDKRIANPRDWNFTVNQTQFWLTQREKEGELDVKLAHNMPSFSHFVMKIGDGVEQKIAADNAVWPLVKGENRFQVQAVNLRGLRGPASWARVKYN